MPAVVRCIVLGVPWWLAASDGPADPGDDRANSVGRWGVGDVDANGGKIDPELVALPQVAFRVDGSWSVLFKGLSLAEGTSMNGLAATPETFEMEIPGGEHARPQRYVGIYLVDGDVRLLCFVEELQPRPDEFAAPRGSGRLLMKLKRGAAKRGRQSVKASSSGCMRSRNRAAAAR